jgi:hypothetical protein
LREGRKEGKVKWHVVGGLWIFGVKTVIMGDEIV